jgi:hypothetical protein
MSMMMGSDVVTADGDAVPTAVVAQGDFRMRSVGALGVPVRAGFGSGLVGRRWGEQVKIFH